MLLRTISKECSLVVQDEFILKYRRKELVPREVMLNIQFEDPDRNKRENHLRARDPNIFTHQLKILQ